VPTVGSYLVSGRTLTDATLLIEAGFSSHFPGIRAGVGLAGVRSYLVTVTGQVRTPGLVEILGSDRVTDVLTAAGGIDQVGSLTRIQIIHRDGDTTRVDLTGFLLDGIQGCNPMLRMGDRVVVPAAEQFVIMEGAFQVNPFCVVSTIPPTELTPWIGSLSGRLEYVPGETVRRFVNRVGGTSAWADREACYVVRMDPDSILVAIPAPLDGPSISPVLLPGDRVICPGIPPQVAVSGVVTTPGVYPHVAGMDVFYYISLAGGYTHESYQGGTRVVLPDGGVLDPDEMIEVPAGATITVPRKVLVWWQDPLLVATSIATIIIAWKSV
jgi:protein involved in polysaccharide export with SLBB domain